MTDDQPSCTEKDLHFLPDQQVRLDDFSAPGPILDIGGGGEGVIGQLKPRQTVAIDTSRRELLEAGSGAVQLVAFRLTINLPGQQIQTGYGTRWPRQELDHEYYQNLTARLGLQIVQEQTFGKCFQIQWKKPRS